MALPILPFVAGAAVGSVAAWLYRDPELQRAVRERLGRLYHDTSAEIAGLWPLGRGNGAAEPELTGTPTAEEAVAALTAVKGVGEGYAQLLVAAGIDTPEKLAAAEPEDLHRRLTEANEGRELVRTIPSVARLEAWIQSAREHAPA
jgi:hypothetical protein